jgi:hypothetical protein
MSRSPTPHGEPPARWMESRSGTGSVADSSRTAPSSASGDASSRTCACSLRSNLKWETRRVCKCDCLYLKKMRCVEKFKTDSMKDKIRSSIFLHVSVNLISETRLLL